MASIPGPPDEFKSGIRQLKAAKLKKEMEAKQREAAASAASEVDDAADEVASESPAEEEVVEVPQAEPVGQGEYVVHEGDCMASIAVATGHFWDTLWTDPANSELRETRQNPNVLLEGDRVTIPELRRKDDPGQTEMLHEFRRKGMPERLRVQLKDDGEPRPNVEYILRVGGDIMSGVTDADGWLEHPIPPEAKVAKLIIEGDEEVTIELGAMPPVSTHLGVDARLKNLGLVDEDLGDGELDEETRERVLRELQQNYGLPATGVADEATQAKLLELHQS